ncbi:MAG TPA: hypothetical protein VHG91_08975 [Longimicrobium sp.]|nr:hypothetical protein [Longimicrobium sp.]
MKILVTGSRAPVALEMVRAFARGGHTVYAADTMRWTMASHSRHLARHVQVPPPRFDREGFAAALERVVVDEGIDVVVPTSEEVFHVARAYDRLAARTRVFTMPLPVLAELHHKGRFQALAASLGVRTPRTTVVSSADELRAALPDFPAYLLKPAFSRFATRIVTNRGPLAGKAGLGEVRPTADEPWLVQDFVEGELVCTYSTLHEGRVTAHCAYETPFKVDGGSGVRFVSVGGAPSLGGVSRIGAALGYTGQLSFDFIRTGDGLVVLECNPRATSGAHLLDAEKLAGGILDPHQPTWTEPPGRHGQLWAPLLASAKGTPRGRRGALARALATGGDVVMRPGDPLPALAQLRLALHFARVARRHGLSLTAATTHDIEWNGEP